MQRFPDTVGEPLDFKPRPAAEDTLSHLSKKIEPTGQNAAPNTVTAPRIRRRNRMITSCLECRRRKLKCDKSHPCTNCTKFSRDCVFLAPALDSASQLKLTEIKEKMGSLERVLEQDAKKAGLAAHAAVSDEVNFAPEPEDEKELEPSPLAVVDAVYDDDADDDLMDLGIQMGKLRLTDRIGGFFRPKMSDEITLSLDDVRNDRRSPEEKSWSPELPTAVPARPQSYLAPGPTYIPPTTNFFFSSASHGTSLIDYLPSKQAADRLLQQYWYAVHPIARIVHRPSFQIRYDIFWNEVQLGIEPIGSLQAVVFSAMFSGVVSMPEEIIMHDFGVAKKDLVENFQQGAETALMRANLLRTTKIETMQAFVMYMIPLCRDQLSRAHSALVGTGIRLAECMGLHRDGSQYGLKPIEIHVRRLIWYQLCFLDIRTCEAQGPRPGIREGEFDTELPLNMNDIELDQNLPPTKPAKHWTDMTLPLIRMECTEMMRKLWFDRPRLEKKEISLTAVLGKIENFKRIMNEKYEPMFNNSIPIQYYTHLVMRVLLARMYIMVLHRYHNSVAFRIPDRLRQIIITSGVEQVEDAIKLETTTTLSPWFWYAGAYQQFQTAFLLLAEIFAYPTRREADRIWRIMDFVFEPPLYLTREQKSRLILTEIRDRISVYRDARKLRVPQDMIQKLGGTSLAGQVRHSNASTSPSSMTTQPLDAQPTPDSLRTFDDRSSASSATHVPSSAGSVSSAHTMPPPGMPQEMSMKDDLMADIDWDEWDRLFPSTGSGEAFGL